MQTLAVLFAIANVVFSVGLSFWAASFITSFTDSDWFNASVSFPARAMIIVLSQLLLFALWKWLIVGRLRSGNYPAWGHYHFRIWMITLLWRFNSIYLIPLAGTETLNMYLRLCGAKIGRNVSSSTIRSGPSLS